MHLIYEFANILIEFCLETDHYLKTVLITLNTFTRQDITTFF